MADAQKATGRPVPPPGTRPGAREPREPDEIALPERLEERGQAGETGLLRGEDVGRGMPVPLAELARAFQASAEALRGVHDMQADMAQALKRSDRSEMMLQSTQALNETFRGLMLIQRELLTRVSATAAPPRSRAVPLMILGLLVVVIGGILFVLDYVDERAGGTREPAMSADGGASLYKEGFDKGAEEKTKEAFSLRQQLEKSQQLEEETRKKLDAEREAVDGLKRSIQAIEAERDEIAAQAGVARNEAIRGHAIEGELRDVSTKLAGVEPEIRRLETDLASQKSENLRLKKRLGSFELGLPPEDAPATPTKTSKSSEAPETPARAPGEPGATALAEQKPPEAPPLRDLSLVRDPRLIAQVRSRLNDMLEVSGKGRGSYFQVTRIDGLAEDRLSGVIALQYDGKGRLLESVEAKRLAIWIDRTRREVHFEFREGERKSSAGSFPFDGGRYELIVADGDLIKIWGQSGLVMIKSHS